MPLYEYKCSKCDRVFEVLQRFSDAPIKLHEGCGGKVDRLLTAPNFKFKGTGFYITDYPNKAEANSSHDSKAPNDSKASNGSEGSNGKDTSGKEASKPATPAPASASTTPSKPAPASSSTDK